MILDSILNIGNTLIDKLIPDKQVAEQAKLKLIELQQQGEFKIIDAELEQLRIEQQDKVSARQREILIAQTGKKDIVPPMLAFLLTVGFFGLLTLIIFRDIDKEAMQILNIMIGSLGAGFTMMLGYYFGSSSSSRKKDELIENITKKIN